ncbi:peptidoglycan DD-metalloendopeptidase family protein [Candidatus Latescibacterota bacterium]
MAWKKLTFILIPHSQSGIKQITLTRAYIFGALSFLVLAIGVMVFYILGFEGKEFYVSKTKEIFQRNQILQKNLAHYDSMLTTMSNEVDSIYKVNEDIPKQFDISQRDLKLSNGFTIVMDDVGVEMPLERVLFLIDHMDKRSAAFEYNYDDLFAYCDKIDDYLRHLPSIRPANGIITREFKHAFDLVANEWKLHPGVDINNVEGTQVIATADGTIEKYAKSNQLGRYIVIDHQNGYKTRYAHLQEAAQMKKKIRIKKGDKVTRGQQIGCIGRTGREFLAAPSRVEYSVEHHGELVNPVDFFFASEHSGTPVPETSVAQSL